MALCRCFRLARLLVAPALAALAAGCAALPEKLHEPLYHNPFPQLHRVAILPFYNQSAEPTVNGDEVAIAYYNELQAIPGFEVMPVGVARQMLAATGIEPRTASDFQRLARLMNVDAVLVGSVTEFSPYYPPRMGLAVDWYAANPGFHPIPPGYGLPWGTSEEEYIPSALVQEAEFALARQQLATQTPQLPPALDAEAEVSPAGGRGAGAAIADEQAPARLPHGGPEVLPPAPPRRLAAHGGVFPGEWPDPRGFIPPSPQKERPTLHPQHEPIISHVRVYHGNDSELTQRLASYFDFRDDARFGGWEGYLQRPDDFVRFCCRMHVTETLAARGGAGASRVVWRWPISRYER
jgi:hypothetical protein